MGHKGRPEAMDMKNGTGREKPGFIKEGERVFIKVGEE